MLPVPFVRPSPRPAQLRCRLARLSRPRSQSKGGHHALTETPGYQVPTLRSPSRPSSESVESRQALLASVEGAAHVFVQVSMVVS